jgi:hypothetical protein
MLESYNDIRSRIPEQPKWHDEHGVPRYDDFHPSLSPNVYAAEVLLYEIACQNCDARYLVEENWNAYDLLSIISGKPTPALSDRVRRQAVHYGDPPCWECGAGATMNCLDIRTVQFWTRDNDCHEWERVPELEGLDLEDGKR